MKRLTNSQERVSELLEAGFDITKVYSISELLTYAGYATKPNGRILKEVKSLLTETDIDIRHFTHNGRPPTKIINVVCPVCGTKFGYLEYEKPRTTCSYSCANTYFRSGKDHPNYKEELTEGSYRRRALEYYGAKCLLCDEYEVTEVHHIDGNRDNNSMDNLVVLCPTHHTKVHRGLVSI